MSADPVERIEALLPQTQCRRCGYPDCRDYAVAIVEAGEAINRCPPGGANTIGRLAAATGRRPAALNPECGVEEQARLTAYVREAECIGCYKCIAACPVDAIVGAPKWMHSVLASECSGCALCLPACPVDCIELRPNPAHERLARTQSGLFQARYRARTERLRREAERQRQRRARAGRERRIARLLAAARERVDGKC